MLLICLFIILILLGIVFTKSDGDTLDIIGDVFIATGICGLAAFGLAIVVNHATADNIIQKNRIQYDGLCKRREIIKSGYEDVSKSELIVDISEWNAMVYNTKYWTENPFTNWLNPKSIADNLEYIPLE